MIEKAMLWQMDSKDFESEIQNAIQHAQAKYGKTGKVFVRPEVAEKVQNVTGDKSVTPGGILVEIV